MIDIAYFIPLFAIMSFALAVAFFSKSEDDEYFGFNPKLFLDAFILGFIVAIWFGFYPYIYILFPITYVVATIYLSMGKSEEI